MKPDFSEYSILLEKDNKKIFSMTHGGLRPLMMCMEAAKGMNGCTLYDKVVGLAAARIIVHTGIVKEVHAGMASEKAVALLKDSGIILHSNNIVASIMNKEMKDTCPMEKKASNMDNKEFYESTRKIFFP